MLDERTEGTNRQGVPFTTVTLAVLFAACNPNPSPTPPAPDLLTTFPNPSGLASRAPYFHNGSAGTLRDAVHFYNTRFDIKLSEGELNDLVAFLKTL